MKGVAFTFLLGAGRHVARTVEQPHGEAHGKELRPLPTAGTTLPARQTREQLGGEFSGSSRAVRWLELARSWAAPILDFYPTGCWKS